MKNPTANFFKQGSGRLILTTTGTFVLLLILITGCYQFRSIKQPSTWFTESYFDVPIVVERDKSFGDNGWAQEHKDIGLFGVMIPDGWTVTDSIPYTIICKYEASNNTGYLIYDAGHSKTLQDSLAAPEGYHWWGAITDHIADLTRFDSLYFVPRISTNDIVGKFYLRYAVGDRQYRDRNPADQFNYGGGLSDPIEIDITMSSGIQEVLNKANISIFPNPSSDVLNINMAAYNSEVIRMKILDIRGTVVMTREILQNKNTFDIGELSKGLYIVELRNGKNMSSHRIVVE